MDGKGGNVKSIDDLMLVIFSLLAGCSHSDFLDGLSSECHDSLSMFLFFDKFGVILIDLSSLWIGVVIVVIDMTHGCEMGLG